jgi:hypothetical protein
MTTSEEKQRQLQIICDNFIAMLVAQELTEHPNIVQAVNRAAVVKDCKLRFIGYTRRGHG